MFKSLPRRTNKAAERPLPGSRARPGIQARPNADEKGLAPGEAGFGPARRDGDQGFRRKALIRVAIAATKVPRAVTRAAAPYRSTCIIFLVPGRARARAAPFESGAVLVGQLY